MDDRLHDEGFTDVRYVWSAASFENRDIARGDVDFAMLFMPPALLPIDAGEPIVILAGCIRDATSLLRTKAFAPSST